MKMIDDSTNINDWNFVVNGETIETVREFNYLGVTISDDCNDTKDIRKRMAIARNAVITDYQSDQRLEE